MSSGDSQLMNHVVRMVVPMRREFGLALDVGQFLHDVAYARDVLARALASSDPRLRECAAHVEQRLLGPRMAETPAAPAAPAAPEAAGDAERQMRERMRKKYTAGLR